MEKFIEYIKNIELDHARTVFFTAGDVNQHLEALGDPLAGALGDPDALAGALGNPSRFIPQEHGVVFWLKLSSSQTLKLRLTSRRYSVDLNLFTFNRKKFPVKEIISEAVSTIQPETSTHVKQVLSKPYVKTLEQALLKLSFFPKKHYDYICSTLALAQSYNYLLIIIGGVCFIYRLVLANTTNSSNLKEIYSDLYVLSLPNGSTNKKEKKFGNWKFKYLVPASKVSNQFIENIYSSQLKDKKSLSKYQISNDFQVYRTEFENLLKRVTILIYFYAIFPVISLIIKIILTHLYWSFFIISTQCSPYVSNFIPLAIKNINNFNMIINLKFYLVIIFAAIINYIALYLSNKSANKIDSFLLNKFQNQKQLKKI